MLIISLCPRHVIYLVHYFDSRLSELAAMMFSQFRSDSTQCVAV